ncbi:hypothetical protein K7X08_026663 [Anisodus acutangulus]|uniref:Uncharacterized protein n=1 Tax=Anisodus acutangulus TaxID=402998 RepID=A0A9Q1L8X0_9SOLA|nr:hypothetical protein K7X08_026663 [Anisodus acutangulus]
MVRVDLPANIHIFISCNKRSTSCTSFSFLPDLVQAEHCAGAYQKLPLHFSREPLEVGSAASLGVTFIAITIDLF